MSKGKRKTYGSHFSQYATPKPEPDIPDDFEAVSRYRGQKVTMGILDEMTEFLNSSEVYLNGLPVTGVTRLTFNEKPRMQEPSKTTSGYKAWAETRRDLFLEDQRRIQEDKERQRQIEQRQLTNPNWGEFA